MNTHTGGAFAGIKRSLSGGSLFITDFTAMGPGHIAFAPRFPGTIVARRLAPHESLICRKETFLCAEKSVMLKIVSQHIGAGFFGGEGFILQRVTGPGPGPGPGVVWLDPRVNSWSAIWLQASGSWSMRATWGSRNPRCNSPSK